MMCTRIPDLKDNEQTKSNMLKLEALVDEFAELVERSGRTRNTLCRILCYYLSCCKCICCRCTRFLQRGACKQRNQAEDLLFGDLYQSKLIMEKNFEGRQFLIPSIPGRNQPQIDCMFFPATHGDKIVLDPDILDLKKPEDFEDKKYLEKSTIIMSNPNALIYQWMVTSANAYWLDFFLRRDANVLIWNCRGYGESEQSIFSPNYDPGQQKVDAERVLQFLINRIQVKGQIGVYGRSIGGIAASHLVAKFPTIIKVFVGDRTMGKLESLIKNRFPKGSYWTAILYRMWTCRWNQDNSHKFLENATCYKIHCADQNDDTVDIFSSHHHEIAKRATHVNYETDGWKTFFFSLQLLFKMEHTLSEHMENTKDIEKQMLEQMDIADKHLLQVEASRSSINPLSLSEKENAKKSDETKKSISFGVHDENKMLKYFNNNFN